ncbi:hypothetical protein HPP92_000765 [Vanilla planifolia]|uniref:Uncharacterized protein n=1 Tax=Vanilla planifolia TaxID=51239 RepID=A0A835VCX7_VANPL|nr:hypothetical protein HPP92_000765 [Vanilla planifolia]
MDELKFGGRWKDAAPRIITSRAYLCQIYQNYEENQLTFESIYTIVYHKPGPVCNFSLLGTRVSVYPIEFIRNDYTNLLEEKMVVFWRQARIINWTMTFLDAAKVAEITT